VREVQRLVERKERVQKNIESDCVNEFCLLDCWLVLLSAIFKKVVFELRQLVQHVILLVSDEKRKCENNSFTVH
jgi:hypothetical protein